MKIGDVVYKLLNGDGVVYELLITGELRKNTGIFRGPGNHIVFDATQLKKFDLQDGWQNQPEAKNYRYSTKNTFLTKREALGVLQQAHSKLTKDYQAYCGMAEQAVQQAQANLKRSQDQLEKMKTLNVAKLFGLETYTSIFTGEEI